MQKNILRILWKQILALALVGVVIIVGVIPFVLKEIALKEAVFIAQNTAQQYSELRRYYTKNIVSKLKGQDKVSASSDYKAHEFGIPLPATMIHELSKSSKSSGLQIKLYSPYPFPGRSDRVLDEFQQQAWQQLKLTPNQPFLKNLQKSDSKVVRVAIADNLTEQACVDCHNSHPDTPKNDWKLGDVRGVLEIVVPINKHLNWQKNSSYQLSVIFVLVFLLIFIALVRILSKESNKQTKAILTPLKNQKFALNAHSLVSMADKQGNIIYVNDMFCEVSGYAREELLGKKHSVLNSGNQSKSYWKDMHKCVLAGEVWHDEVRNKAKKGHYYWVDTTIVPNYDEANKVIGFTSIRTDITQQVEFLEYLEQAKRQAEAANFALNQHSLVSIADIKGTISYVNKQFCKVSGYEKSELLGEKHSILNSAHQPKGYWKDMHLRVLAGEVWHDEVRNKAKNGQYYWVDTTIVPNFDKDKQVIGFTSIRTDISDKKEASDLLAMAKDRAEADSADLLIAKEKAEADALDLLTAKDNLLTAKEKAEADALDLLTAKEKAEADALDLLTAKEQAESANFALDQHSLVSTADIKGTILYVNDKFVEISGFDASEIVGKKHNLLNSGNQPKDYWKHMHQQVIAGNVWHDEVRNRKKNGDYYWVDTTIVPNFDMANKVIGFTSIRTDITEQKENQRRLERAITEAESAQFALDEHSLVSMADIKGTITYVNEKFVEVSGYESHELVGQKHALLNSAHQPKGYWKAMHRRVLSGETWREEVRNKAKDGHYYWVDTTIVPNFDSNEEVIGFTSIRTDITAQKDNMEKLARAKEEAEAASISKADFLANMSHEIRTPMNGVIGMTNLLLDTELNAAQDKLANTVKSSAVGLLGIINDILDFSKVEAGKMDLELIPFNLGQMVEDVGTALSFQADRKHLHLICPANPIIQQWVKADPGRLRQILTNLIGNGVKFTEQGEVAVFVKLLHQTDEHKTFRFEVKDTGIGVTVEQQQQLFDKFTQADTSTTRKYGGTGLGLSICKQLVELMGGEIGIDSVIGQGCTFWFEVPLLNTKALVEAPVYNTDITNERILIVDDNETNRDLMKQLHDHWKIPHTLVNSARSAIAELTLAALEECPYTIAVLDMNMPDTSGLELCKQIREIPQLEKTKLIMASSQAQRGDAAKMKEAGFKGYLTKPIHQSELFDVLLMVSGLKASAPDFITRHSTKEHVQFKAHILVVEDNPTNQLVIEGLLRTLGVTVDIASNGQEAISALQSITLHDLVFMDCQMPVLDGYAATAKIRGEKLGILHNNIPIIAMTANAMAGDREKCLDVGMDDYLAKPIVPAEVIDMLIKWLPKHAKPRNVEEIEEIEVHKGEIDVQKEESVAVFDYDDMAGRLMGDVELMQSVAEIFFEDVVEQLANLKTAVETADVEKSTAIMHQIKGAALNVGGKSLGALALKMEQAGKAEKLAEIEQNVALLEQELKALKMAMEQALS